MDNEKQKEKLFNLYTLAELSYQRHFKEVTNNVDELYPVDWYNHKNYKLKIEILAEAIKTNRLVVNTRSYQKLIEGVVNYNN